MSFLRKTDPSRPSLLVLRHSFDEANPADVTMTCSMNPPTRVRRRHNAWLHMIDARGRADRRHTRVPSRIDAAVPRVAWCPLGAERTALVIEFARRTLRPLRHALIDPQ